MITSLKIKKYIRSANRVAKSINNSIAEDNLWRGRFIMRQKKFQFYQYDDKSGLHVDFWYEFEDLKTGQKKIYLFNNLEMDFNGPFISHVWWAMNSFIVDYCDVIGGCKMEPIINPWVFYLIDGASTLKWGALIFGFVLGLVLLGCGVYSIGISYSKEEWESAKKKMKTGTTICIIGIVLFLIVPSSETVMKMIIAKNVTYDAVDAAKDVVVQVYNDILALFQK